jgi:hypothetical protein
MGTAMMIYRCRIARRPCAYYRARLALLNIILTDNYRKIQWLKWPDFDALSHLLSIGD